jgi:beta-glucanase (GH16 family)
LLTNASTPLAQTDPHAGEPLDIRNYALTFDEPFDHLDVSAWGPGTRWIAHTPWHGDFGDAQFIDPQPGEPFRIVNGMLQIEMKQQEGQWRSGLLSSGDQQGRGFLQSGGYFEMRAKFPGGPGVWPAFWLGSNAPDGKPNPEIDVVEYYGKFPGIYKATTHIWHHGQNVSGTAYDVIVPSFSLENAFHTYGVAIDPATVIFYLDGKEVAREKGRPEYLQPLFLMVNLAAGGGWPIAGMHNPSVLYVDYIRAYQRKGIKRALEHHSRKLYDGDAPTTPISRENQY